MFQFILAILFGFITPSHPKNTDKNCTVVTTDINKPIKDTGGDTGNNPPR